MNRNEWIKRATMIMTEFVDKVETGKAKSNHTYEKCKELLSEPIYFDEESEADDASQRESIP